MHTPRRFCVLRLTALLLVSLIVTGIVSHDANARRSVTINRFRASETPLDDFHLSRPIDFGHLRFGAQIHLDYANDPLVFERTLGSESSEMAKIIEHQLNLTLGLSLGLGNRFVLFAGLPVVAMMDGDSDTTLAPLGVSQGADGAGLGDIYLGARARLVGENNDLFGLALQVTGTFPSAGSDQLYRGDDFLTLHPELLMAIRPSVFRFVFNLGSTIRKRSDTENLNLELNHELTFGLGGSAEVYRCEDATTRHLDLYAQIYGASEFKNFFERENTPLEAIGGLKFFHESGVIAGAAAGAGLTRGFGSPDVRLIGMIGYALPERPQVVPVVAETDRDQDGILDKDDSCPNDPEDVDGFEDSDGCPDPDNDQDGVLDVNDKCPNKPEDVDGFEDSDGCPDPDNDQDGVLDVNDKCPNKPGSAEFGGCPPPDRDGDGVADHVDNCPDEPGRAENQGCKARQRVVIKKGKLVILDKVFFRTNRARIRRRSFALLLNVARVLNNHQEIKHIRIEGHTDIRGRRAYNIDLSMRRAQAVQRFLVTKGHVASARLEALGLGPDQLIIPNAQSRSEHAQNRRVEFRIISDQKD